MRLDRRWRFAALGACVLAVAGVLTFVLVADDGNDAGPLATGATTSTSAAAEDTIASSSTAATSTAPTTTASTAAPVPVTRAPTARTTTTPARCPPPARGSDFDGFGAAEIVIENAEGSRRSCVLTADTPAHQQRGLMQQNDLDGYDGMIFRFQTAEEQSFWMRNTSIPLSIAFFDAGGGFVSASDMEPCGDSPECPNYNSGGAAKFALEVIRGRLPAVGATPDSRLVG